ncbi:Chondroitin sulfate N-acetylgalactosaminyltransferase 1 [Gracilariopsis chorda]|uniref:Chondroitin sulfate N-acetylgalactosaminyltransferase 1 n=1 Tax=Gracilariopsis chorda TaxID=448386 RepID=A0A2V3IGH9_9FLOR|nr:Chondroitin sulfate N-acetylgalactosaminyltransferase 1 [Gracilariopsis chorda]|eukprot:PXF41206.1 Chondroitin sulfate N-acetylgalactosaminyltransferase 1 [Gracilariopsis chorda]
MDPNASSDSKISITASSRHRRSRSFRESAPELSRELNTTTRPLEFILSRIVLPLQLTVIVFLLTVIARKNRQIVDVSIRVNQYEHQQVDSEGKHVSGRVSANSQTSSVFNWLSSRRSNPVIHRCPEKTCSLDEWNYIGEKCYYRREPTKDVHAHNSSIWQLVQHDLYYSEEFDFACPVTVCRKQWNEEINKTEHLILRVLLEHYQNDTPWNLERMYYGNKYVRMNHFWGLEYKLNGGFTLTTTDDDGAERVDEKNATITIRRGFTQKFCDVLVDTEVPQPETPIYVVVPYIGRLAQLQYFYTNIKELIDGGVNLRVVVATHGGPVHILGAAETLREMQLGLTEGDFADGHRIQVVETTGDHHGNFSRSKALLDGSKYVPYDALMFICDVDMMIKKEFFDNCRYNTRRNHQVYYPVMYSLYPYGSRVEKEHGYWRTGAFGEICVYNSDFQNTEAWATDENQRKLVGWGYEDIALHEEFTNHPQISIFHAVEPNLLHRWHPKYCDFNKHVSACLGTVYQNMGSQRFLAKLVAYSGVELQTVEYVPEPVIFREYKNESTGEMMGGTSQTNAKPQIEEGSEAWEKLKDAYQHGIREGKAGLISTFAMDALDAKDRTSAKV